MFCRTPSAKSIDLLGNPVYSVSCEGACGLTPWPPLHQRWRGGKGDCSVCFEDTALTLRISDCPYLFADGLLQQITLDTYRRQQLCLCLRSERQPPQFDETQRSIVVELITTIIRCQALAIERMLRFATNDSAMPR